MSALTRTPFLGAAWTEAVQGPLDGFINCVIELIDFDLATNDDYDWRTNTVTPANEPKTLYCGEAQVQVYRFTLTMDAPVGSVDQTRNARFTIKGSEIGMDLDIRKGQRVFVRECPLNPALTRFQYFVNSGFNSGSPARRTIETEVDMARII